MPSSHALSLAFLATLCATALPPAGGGALLVAAGGVAATRVRPGVHTAPQVAVGFAVGVANALVWHALVTPALAPAIAAAAAAVGGTTVSAATLVLAAAVVFGPKP